MFAFFALTEEEAYQLCLQEPRTVAKLLVELLAKVEVLQNRVDELERRLKLNSSNSSKPPSTDSPFDPKTKKPSNAEGKKRKPGGQKGREGKNLKMVQEPDSIIVSSPQMCSGCGSSLVDITPSSIASRQVFDLPVLKIEVTEHQAHTKKCPCCKAVNKGIFPIEVKAPTQYGKRFDATIAYLSIHQMLPYERITQVISDLFGHPVSEGTILNALSRVETLIKPSVVTTKESLLGSPVLHVDETGINVRGVLHWAHIALSGVAATCLLHPKRGTVAINAMDILPNYTGIAVHDHWKPYESIGGLFEHAFCNAHHLRELTRAWEQEKQQWSQDMFKWLLLAHKKVTQAKGKGEKSLSSRMLKYFNARYDAIIQAASVYHQKNVDNPEKKRRIKQTFAKNLLDRLIKYKDGTLRFLTNFEVPFTNNAAEQGLRMMKVKEKISGCFMSREGGRIFMSIYSYILTAKKNGLNSMNALIDAVNGNPFLPAVAVKSVTF
ncbi:MAG: IS66 family transposase [Sulfuricurvum sp.]|jgi:transposase